MRFRILWLLLLFCLISAPCWAHKVHLFAYAEAESVKTESYFPDGRPVAGGQVSVYDTDGSELYAGETDAEGGFSFPVPSQEVEIVLDAGLGHKTRSVWAPEETELPHEHPTDAAAVVETHDACCAELVALEEQLQTLEHELAAREAAQQQPAAAIIIGGLGWIVGLFGIAAFVASRRKTS